MSLNNLGRKGFTLHPLPRHSASPSCTGTQDRNLEAGADAEAMGGGSSFALHVLLSLFLIAPYATYPGVATPSVSWVFLHL